MISTNIVDDFNDVFIIIGGNLSDNTKWPII